MPSVVFTSVEACDVCTAYENALERVGGFEFYVDCAGEDAIGFAVDRAVIVSVSGGATFHLCVCDVFRDSIVGG